MKSKTFILFIIGCMALAACAPPSLPQTDSVPETVSQPTESTDLHSTEESYSDTPHIDTLDVTRLTIGDAKYSTSPQAGYVYSCQTTFNFNGQGGQGQAGNWNNGDGTWNAMMKAVIDGSVTWPHDFSISIQGDQRVFTGNGLPDHTTGVYPVSSSDDAYTYDRNPNSISEQNITLTLPANPTVASQPTCIGGEVGIMLSGVVLFSAFDALGQDALVHEVQDACDGHPQVDGVYHYHSLSDCLEDTVTGPSALMGYAFDGFGIYGYYGEDGKEVTNADLDECHGHTGLVEWDGQMVEMYHYHATREFPYTVGCFKGTPSVRSIGGQGQNQQTGQGDTTNQGQQDGTGQQPPQEAIDVCIGLTQGASCSVGNMTGTCMTPPNTSELACVPAGGPPP